MKRALIFTVLLMLTAVMLMPSVGAVSRMPAAVLSGEVDLSGLIVPALIVGFIISLVLVLAEKSKMTTVKPSREAGQYIVDGSLRLTVSQDRYLYKNVTRRPRNTDKKK